MNYKTDVWRWDGLMLAAGLSIALISGSARAENATAANSSYTPGVVAETQPAEKGKQVAPESLNRPPATNMTYTVVMPSNGSAIRLPLLMPANYRGVATEKRMNRLPEKEQVTLRD